MAPPDGSVTSYLKFTCNDIKKILKILSACDLSESPYAVYLKSTELLIVLYTRIDTVSYCILFVVND